MGRPIVDLTDQTFGSRKVLRFSHLNKYGSAMFSCRCECGATHVVRSNNLRRGGGTQCMNCNGRIDLTGQVFGSWKVLKYSHIHSRKVVFFCRCECGATHRVMGTQLRNGRSTQCKRCAIKMRYHNRKAKQAIKIRKAARIEVVV